MLFRNYLKVPPVFILEKKETILLAFVFFILFSTYPYVFYRIIPLPPIVALQAITICFYFTIKKKFHGRFFSKFSLVVFLQLLGVLLCMVANLDLGYYKQLIYIIWAFIFIDVVSFIPVKKFLFYYGRILLFVGILGAISTILCLIFGIHPILEYTNADGRPGWLVYFTFTNMQVLDIIRYSGIFDEAGAYANWVMFYLILNRVYVHDNKIEIPLIIVTLFTMSLGFYFQLVPFVFFYYIMRSSLKNKITFVLLLSLSIGVTTFFINDESPIYKLTIERLGFGGNIDFLEDNNRVEMIKIAREMFHDNPVFGVGTTKFYAGEYASDNPYETLAKDGIIGTFFIYFPLIWTLFVSRFDKRVIISTFILIIGYFQRPFHINLQHYIMLYLFAYCCFSIVRYHQNIYNEKLISSDKDVNW